MEKSVFFYGKTWFFMETPGFFYGKTCFFMEKPLFMEGFHQGKVGKTHHRLKSAGFMGSGVCYIVPWRVYIYVYIYHIYIYNIYIIYIYHIYQMSPYFGRFNP